MDAETQAGAMAAFRAAVALAKSQSAFARATGAKQQNVSNWLKRGVLLPGEYVISAEREFGISRHDLRPDLYPRESAQPHASGLDALGAAR